MTLTIHECVLRHKETEPITYDAGAFVVTFPSSDPKTSLPSSLYHITSRIPEKEKPSISNSFLRSSSVTRIPFHMTLSCTFVYFHK